MTKNQSYRPWIPCLIALIFSFVFEGTSLAIVAPVLENARTQDGVLLALKHFPQFDGNPILFIHGVATNDRQWDLQSPARASVAQFFAKHGYDVWVANLRGFGTAGYRSEAPSRRWSVDDYAIYDLPALIEMIFQRTGKTVWLIGHSLGVQAIEGYLGGMDYDEEGHPYGNLEKQRSAFERVRGLISIAGVHNLWWPRSVKSRSAFPVDDELEYSQSNYILELLANFCPIYLFTPLLKEIPLSRLATLSQLSFSHLPLMGLFPKISELLDSVYAKNLDRSFHGPIFSMIFNAKNMEEETFRIFLKDGIENVPTQVLEQLGNTIRFQKTQNYFHLRKKKEVYYYGSAREKIDFPSLFIAGSQDRLTHLEMIWADGFEQYQTEDKRWVLVDAGHFDILTGKNTRAQVLKPMLQWLLLHDERDQRTTPLLNEAVPSLLEIL